MACVLVVKLLSDWVENVKLGWCSVPRSEPFCLRVIKCAVSWWQYGETCLSFTYLD